MTPALKFQPEIDFFSDYRELRQQIFDPERKNLRIGLAVSGGTDSAALLCAAAQSPYAKNCVTFTLNHGFRPSAAEETLFVQKLSLSLGIPCEILTLTGGAPKTGLQNYAREARYTALANAAKQAGVTAVCTGHHFDDAIETALQRAEKMFPHQDFRDIPPAYGLAGMQEAFFYDGVCFIRPFLAYRRCEIAEYLRLRKVTPLFDPSNENEKFQRVRVRNFLNHPDNVTVRAHFARITAESAALRASVDREVTAFYQSSAYISSYGFVEFSTACFRELSEGAGREALRFACQFVSGKPRPPNVRVEFLQEKFAQPVGAFNIGGAEIRKSQNKILIAAELRERPAPQPVEVGRETAFMSRFLLTHDCAGIARLPTAQEAKRIYSALVPNVRKTLPVIETEKGVFVPKNLRYSPSAIQKFISCRDSLLVFSGL